jgi:hypothetical protein
VRQDDGPVGRYPLADLSESRFRYVRHLHYWRFGTVPPSMDGIRTVSVSDFKCRIETGRTVLHLVKPEYTQNG